MGSHGIPGKSIYVPARLYQMQNHCWTRLLPVVLLRVVQNMRLIRFIKPILILPQKNSPESVFACQTSVNDGSATATNGGNGNTGDELNYPYNHGPGCCGFNNPSWNLVQAYKTDANGLPFLDGSYNNAPLVSATTNPWTGTVDPRLDWTAGRPGKPYFDWGTLIRPGFATRQMMEFLFPRRMVMPKVSREYILLLKLYSGAPLKWLRIM